MILTVDTLTQQIGQYLPEPHAGLLAGISFGTKATMSTELVEALTRTGTLHIVALSGMNISIVSGIIMVTLLRFVSRRVASLLTLLIIIGFVWFVGPSASVIRAAIMGGISLIAVVLGRSNWPLFSWMLAVGVMVLINPSWVTDVSFQLSALATLGIILFGSGKETKGGTTSVSRKNFAPSSEVAPIVQIEDGQNFVGSPQQLITIAKLLFHWFWKLIEDDLRVTLAAQAFTIPVILFTFRRISLISPLPNILIGWTIGPLTILGWLASLAGMVFDPVGRLIGWFAWVPLQYVLWIITTTSNIPFASLEY